jgi:type I restriction-modification system DNA methylase subunit
MNLIEKNKAITALIRERGNQAAAYTPEELAFINQYEGYGGEAKNMEAEGLDSKEVLFEYFTPIDIVETMVGLAQKHGYTEGGKVGELSCGTGRFLRYFSPQTPVVACEISETSVAIAQINFPNFDIRHQALEDMFRDRFGKVQNYTSDFDLIIGNPPYGLAKSLRRKEKDATGATFWEEYFVSRGLDLLKRGGLLVFILPHGYFDRSDNAAKTAIAKKSELVDIYRLPHGAFHATGFGTDILILRKL